MAYIKHLILSYGVLTGFILLVIILVVVGIKSKKHIYKHISFNSAAVILGLAIYEIFLLITVDKKTFSYYEGAFTNTPSYWNGSGLQWFGPKKSDFVVDVKKLVGMNTLVYDVKYTLENGLRYSPNTNKSSKHYAIFLGCSFTYGEGLNDNQTLPFYLNEFSGERFNIQNYGFHGYGPHHALYLVENVIKKDTAVTKSDSSVAIYSLIPDHFGRAAGYKTWDKYGPKYEIERDSLVYVGQFAKKRGRLSDNLLKLWEATQIFKQNFSYKEVTKKDIERVMLMLKKMKNDLNQYGIKFIVILDNDCMKYKFKDQILQSLNSSGINYYSVPQIINDIEDSNAGYFIKNDGHPSALYNKKIGEYLSKIIK